MKMQIYMLLYVALNILLLYSYYYMNVQESDFKETPKNLRVYMLVSASIAYLFNIIHTYFMYRRGEKRHFIPLYIYYLLQLLFIPLVRHGNKSYVRLLLFIVCFPIAILFNLAKGNIEKTLYYFQLAHVFVNDFVLFGFLH